MNKRFCFRSERLLTKGNKDNEARTSSSNMPKLRFLRFLLLNRNLSLVLALVVTPAVTSAQSIWRDDAKPMYTDKRGNSVGDIITIVVQENTTTSKDNKTETGKQSGVDASISSFLYSPGASGLLTKGGQMPAMKFNAKNDYSGGGTIANSERMIARIAVKVVDVLPNRNLIVEGKRETAFSGEKQTLVLRGVVREADVLANNTVFSYNVADATIQIVSKGTISDSQRKGWFTRVWDKLTPF
jgi:Flagellar basal body L-ring protein